jgi:hypothetical protein
VVHGAYDGEGAEQRFSVAFCAGLGLGAISDKGIIEATPRRSSLVADEGSIPGCRLTDPSPIRQ